MLISDSMFRRGCFMVERSSLLMRFSFENERSPEHAVVIMHKYIRRVISTLGNVSVRPCVVNSWYMSNQYGIGNY